MQVGQVEGVAGELDTTRNLGLDQEGVLAADNLPHQVGRNVRKGHLEILSEVGVEWS